MKIHITEKQLKLVLSDKDIIEQSTTSTPPSSGGSSGGGSTGYPQVGKWESGVTRGPANQVGLTKWSDVVGSVLKRSKANQLK